MFRCFKDLKISTKSLLGCVAVFSVLWVTPYTHDLIVSVVGPHPRVQAVLALIAGGYALLHQPKNGNSNGQQQQP